MFPFLLFCLATVGLTAILVDGVIFAPLRNWISREAQARRELRENLRSKAGKGKGSSKSSIFEFVESILSCYQCCGFWSGMACGIYLITAFSEIGTPNRSWAVLNTLTMWLCAGLAGSLLAHVYLVTIELIFSATMFVKKYTLDEHEHHHEHEE